MAGGGGYDRRSIKDMPLIEKNSKEELKN